MLPENYDSMSVEDRARYWRKISDQKRDQQKRMQDEIRKTQFHLDAAEGRKRGEDPQIHRFMAEVQGWVEDSHPAADLESVASYLGVPVSRVYMENGSLVRDIDGKLLGHIGRNEFSLDIRFFPSQYGKEILISRE
jgi:hypothetical protein